MSEAIAGEYTMDRGMSTISTFFNDYRDRLVHRAQRILGSYEDAQDVVQDVMVVLLEGPDIIPDIDNLIGWLYTVTRRRCVDLIRSGIRRRNREEKAISLESLIRSIDDPEYLVEQADFMELIAGIISELPAEQQEILIEHELHEISFRELAVKSGVPMGTLMARKKRALDSIRRRLGVRCDTKNHIERRAG